MKRDSMEMEETPFIHRPATDRAKSRGGWRLGVSGWTALVLLVLAVNVSASVYVAVAHGFSDGLGTLAEGDCSRITEYNVAAHLVINILSTLLLSGSNYCMQCLSAPTRQDIDAAHKRGVSLDVGIASFRNLGAIRSWRVWMWGLLISSSLPLHLFYNSVIFATIPANDYVVLGVNDAFLSQSNPLNNISGIINDLYNNGKGDLYAQPDWNPWILELVPELRQLPSSGALERLDNTDCITTYAQTFLADKSNLLLVIANNQSQIPAVIYDNYNQNSQIDANTGCVSDPTPWICPSSECATACMNRLGPILADPSAWAPPGRPVEYCLSQTVTPVCKLRISLTVAVAIICFNAIKATLMLILAFGLPNDRLHTIGDAITSFLIKPCEKSLSRCLHTTPDFRNYRFSPFKPKEIEYTGKRWRFRNACHKSRWVLCYMLYALAIGVCIFLLAYGIRASGTTNGQGASPSFSDMLSLGLGAVTTQTLIKWQLPASGSSGLLANIFVANLPQLILSGIYFTYNSLFTAMLAGQEWTFFALRRTGLRVSNNPRGEQRSTYFLQLPYRFSLPLLVLSGLLHWLVSQSLFLIAIERYDPLGNPIGSADAIACETDVDGCDGLHYTCGWSPLAILLVIGLGLLMVAGVTSFGHRRFKAGMPLGGTDSGVIAAACHVDAAEPEDLRYRKIKWGVVSVSEDHVGHCGFSAGDPTFPEMDIVYK